MQTCFFKVYEAQQGVLLGEAAGRQVKLAGDGRADSPGYNAKYGTYTLLDVEHTKILHYELVQVCYDSNLLKSPLHAGMIKFILKMCI